MPRRRQVSRNAAFGYPRPQSGGMNQAWVARQTLAPAPRSKQLFDLALAEIDEWERPPGGAGPGGVEVEAEALVDCGDDFRRLDGPLGGIAALRIALADGPATLNAAAGEIDAKTLRPVIAPAGRV